MKYRLPLIFVELAMLLFMGSCAKDDVAQDNKLEEKVESSNNSVVTFVAGVEVGTRTSMTDAGIFYWEAGDKIYVKDDDGIWQTSNAVPAGPRLSSFKFKVSGKFIAKTSYTVYYPGVHGFQDQVKITDIQSQTIPNTPDKVGDFGDCGIATATKVTGTNRFEFRLDHKATILVFKPYTNNTALQKCFITKIEVVAEDNIAGTYTLDPVSNQLIGIGSRKEILLNTIGSGVYAKGFPLTNTSANASVNGAYMVIRPGNHTFKVRYWVKDYDTNVEGTVTKVYPSFNYAENVYYSLSVELNVKDYPGIGKYYMWDAQKNYWSGYETVQPVLHNTSNPNYPKDKYDANQRWYHIEGGRADAATTLFKSYPNANEMYWYVKKGDPRWDADELWTSMGHLRKGGLWLKKKAKIGGFRNDKDPDGVDRRNVYSAYSISPSQILPSASEDTDFFYLPAMGRYVVGNLLYIGRFGFYWSSSANPSDALGAYGIRFDSGDITVSSYGRDDGYWSRVFE